MGFQREVSTMLKAAPLSIAVGIDWEKTMDKDILLGKWQIIVRWLHVFVSSWLSRRSYRQVVPPHDGNLTNKTRVATNEELGFFSKTVKPANSKKLRSIFKARIPKLQEKLVKENS
jgi:hypothetical protein